MLKSRLLATTVALAAVAAAPGVADAKPKGMKYVGKLKEGSKVSFVLQGPWIKNLSTMLPYTCGSAQGGLPPIGLAGMKTWAAPYNFKINVGEIKVTDDKNFPTTNYTVTFSGKRGKAITGKLAMNYSETVPANNSYGYAIKVCNATGSFKVKPAKKRRG